MNPVLVKPEADTRSQVVVLGEADHEISRLPWRERRARLWPVVRESLHGLMDDYDVVVIEGAGSPAEINLRDGDIVNMAVALEVAAPVLLCCDIDRGGAFAHLLGTWQCLSEPERDLLAGFLLNRFRGDASLLAPGPEWLEERTGVPTLGVIPWLDVPLPEEDGVALQGAGGGDGRIAIVVAAPHREPRRVRAARRARALRPHARRARGRGRDRDPRAPRARSPIWTGCARPASRGRSRGAPRPACPCSASAAGCRCSAAACATRTASRAAARRRGSACSTSSPSCSRARRRSSCA